MGYVLVGGLSNVNERPVGKVSLLKVTKAQYVFFTLIVWTEKEHKMTVDNLSFCLYSQIKNTHRCLETFIYYVNVIEQNYHQSNLGFVFFFLSTFGLVT